jgi:hypothetical protein
MVWIAKVIHVADLLNHGGNSNPHKLENARKVKFFRSAICIIARIHRGCQLPFAEKEILLTNDGGVSIMPFVMTDRPVMLQNHRKCYFWRMQMYPITLALHSLVRWAVLILAVFTVARGLLGWLGKKEWMPLDDKLGMFLTISADVQLLLGLALYIFLSPLTQAAFKDASAAMADPMLRFFTAEHAMLMVIANVLVHVGRGFSPKAQDAQAKHRLSAILYGIALLAVLAAIPWSRPLIRLGWGAFQFVGNVAE